VLTRLKYLFYSFLSIGLIALGIIIAYSAALTNGAKECFFVLGFFLLPIGSLLFGAFFTQIFASNQVEGYFKIEDSKMNNQKLKTKRVKEKTKSIKGVSLVLFIVMFVFSAYYLFALVENYKIIQLKNYGETQNVFIRKTGVNRSATAYFDFYYDGKTYSNNLSQNGLEVGDSAIIIFSRQNPNVVKWLNDFNTEK
jgi:hypothetical protein